MKENASFAILKNGQVVDCEVIKEKGWWFWKRYLVTFETIHPAHSEIVLPLSGTVLPSEPEYTTIDSEWVKIVGKYVKPKQRP